jgi:hypothetical protein
VFSIPLSSHRLQQRRSNCIFATVSDGRAIADQSYRLKEEKSNSRGARGAIAEPSHRLKAEEPSECDGSDGDGAADAMSAKVEVHEELKGVVAEWDRSVDGSGVEADVSGARQPPRGWPQPPLPLDHGSHGHCHLHLPRRQLVLPADFCASAAPSSSFCVVSSSWPAPTSSSSRPWRPRPQPPPPSPTGWRLLLCARWALSLPYVCGRCLRGERRFNFASPLSSIGIVALAMHLLLESFPDTHSTLAGGKNGNAPSIGVSLRVIFFLLSNFDGEFVLNCPFRGISIKTVQKSFDKSCQRGRSVSIQAPLVLSQSNCSL